MLDARNVDVIKTAQGVVTSATLGQALATITDPGRGRWLVEAHAEFSGTAETARTNVSFRVNAVVVGRVLPGQTAFFVVDTDENVDDMSLNAEAAAVVGAIYAVTLTAYRVS